MPGIDFDAVQRAVCMSDVLDLIGWQHDSAFGEDLRGRCPLHGSRHAKSRIFSVRGEEWYCWRCRKGGGPLRLFALAMELPEYQAARELCRELKIPVPWLPRAFGRQRQRRNKGEG